MLNNSIKFSAFEIMLILIIGSPIGYFIYNNNLNKINYVFNVSSGYLFSDNYCEKFTVIDAPQILTNTTIEKIKDILSARFIQSKPYSKIGVNIHRLNPDAPYLIIFSGKDQDLDVMSKQIDFVVQIFAAEEMRAFEQKFSKIKILCQGKNLTVFNYVAPTIEKPNGVVRYAYSKKFLYFAALSPLLIMFLSLLIYKFIVFNRLNFSIKNINFFIKK